MYVSLESRRGNQPSFVAVACLAVAVACLAVAVACLAVAAACLACTLVHLRIRSMHLDLFRCVDVCVYYVCVYVNVSVCKRIFLACMHALVYSWEEHPLMETYIRT
jgi:hypothetical protein